MKKIKAALAGNPNCGKTTLFNKLTGSNQYVGNWSGVTVEQKAGQTKLGGVPMEIIDLPGIYSLSPYSAEEIVARDYILKENPDVIINIIDGTNIERNLYLSLQLMELGKPLVIAVNMIDEVEAKGQKIDITALSQQLGAPVIPISAKKGQNIRKVVENAVAVSKKQPCFPIEYDFATASALGEIKQVLSKRLEKGMPLDYFASKMLENDGPVKKALDLDSADSAAIEAIAARYEATSAYGDRETMLADARYKAITAITARCVKKPNIAGKITISDKIDRFVTHKILALPIFVLIMFCMFSLTFGPIGTFLSDKIQWLLEDVLSPGVSALLENAAAPAWTHSLLVDAVISGVGSVITFVPQIAILFLCLSILEDSGYMARAAFITDRLLRKLGLSGKSFIPMIMGFGCTTPAVMAARTLENEKDRRMTIMITPFMSCGARLPIYALFAGVFFEKNQGLIVFSMYFIGIFVAVLSGIILKKTLFKGEAPPFVMELPPYRLPGFKSVLLHMWDKTKGFLIKAGTIIFSMSILIWMLQNFNFKLQMTEVSSESIFGTIGRWLAPVFAPLGFGTWQASVALLTGLVAKEAVVSSINVLYAGAGVGVAAALSQAFTPLSAFCFMVFCLLYMPCISAFVTIRKEMNSAKWAWLTAAWQMGAAYIVTLLIYQVGRLFIG